MSLSEPNIEIIKKEESTAIVRTKYNSECIDVAWHTHKEFEIIFVEEGFGSRIIGESVSMFKPGTLMLIGSSVPHLLKSDKNSKNNSQIVIQFSDLLLSKELLFFSEFASLANLKQNSYHGLDFTPQFAKKMQNKIEKFVTISKDQIIYEFYSILNEMALAGNLKKLSTLPYKIENSEQSRIGKIFNYVLNNYMDEISVEKAAEVINLSKPAFCNYFKKKVNKRFSEFVTELRINKACVMLRETELNVSEISYGVGFSNISYFNRSFLKLKGMTPILYRNNSGL